MRHNTPPDPRRASRVMITAVDRRRLSKPSWPPRLILFRSALPWRRHPSFQSGEQCLHLNQNYS